MKIRNIFSIVALASSLLFTSCEKEDNTVGSFDNIKLDKTFLSFPANGGTLDLKVTATEDWKFVVDENWPKVITFKSGKKATHDVWGNLTNDAADIKSSKDSWVQADVTEGKAGEVTVKFTAEAFKGGREQAVAIVCGGHKQQLILRQGDLDPVQLTCKEIKETAAVGASYSTRGVVTKLGNYASYGAFYINDGTYDEDVQVYGSTKDSMKDYPNVEVGDSVYFSGTWSSYKNFENVTITKLKKSLVKMINSSATIAKMGGEFSVKVAYKGNGVFITIPEDCDWVKYVGMDYVKGVPTKIEQNPADTAVAKFSVAANDGAARTCDIKFASYKGSDSSDGTFTVSQKSGLAYLDESFSQSQGKFTIENITLPSGSKFVWSYGGSNYGMKASSYVGGKNLASEALLVSPEVDLTDAETATLTFDHALNYLKSGKIDEHIALLAKKVGDADWTKLEIPTKPAGSNWTFVESGEIDLKAYVGSKMQIAFKYTSTTAVAPTWEVKNVLIK